MLHYCLNLFQLRLIPVISNIGSAVWYGYFPRFLLSTWKRGCLHGWQNRSPSTDVAFFVILV